MPSTTVVLGHAAGLRVRSILLSRPLGERYFERTAMRSPIAEIAGLIVHKLSRQVGRPEAYSQAGSAAVLRALRNCRRVVIAELGSQYLRAVIGGGDVELSCLSWTKRSEREAAWRKGYACVIHSIELPS